MKGHIWMKQKDAPLVEEFYNIFGGQFYIEVASEIVFYMGEDNEDYNTPRDEIKFWDMVSQSVKLKKNLFLKNPAKKIPPGILI